MQIRPVINSWQQKLFQLLYKPVDNSPLILFRICFGFLLFCHCISYILKGKLFTYFIEPPFTFTYIGFEFLQPLPGNGMYFYFALMALLALLIMLGAWYRFKKPLHNAGDINTAGISLSFNFTGRGNERDKLRAGIAHDAMVGNNGYSYTAGSTEAAIIWNHASYNSNSDDPCKPRINSQSACPIRF